MAPMAPFSLTATAEPVAAALEDDALRLMGDCTAWIFVVEGFDETATGEELGVTVGGWASTDDSAEGEEEGAGEPDAIPPVGT